jgi:nitroreductase
MLTNQVIECLTNHRSIRKFQNKKIPEDIINTLLKSGIRAANGGNLQRYSIIVIDDDKTREKISKYDKFNRLIDVPLLIMSLADNYRLKKWFETNKATYQCINSTYDFFLSFYDAVIALHNISIAAESLGLGTYYDGNVLDFDIKSLFNVPEYVFPVGLLCIGYADGKPIPKLLERLPLEAVVHRNCYNTPNNDDINEWHKFKDYIFQKYNTKEKLDEFSKKGIYNIAQAYADAKFNDSNFINERNKKLKENIDKSNYSF